MSSLQDNVLIQANAIDPQELKFLVDYVRRAQKTDSPVSNFEDPVSTEALEWVINPKVRDTQHVKLSPAVRERLNAVEEACVKAFVNPFYKVKVRDREPSQILHYGVGGHYIPHVDAETLYKDEHGLSLWEKTLDRDLSVVLFLNDNFKGGELVFPEFDFTIKPAAGTLVCFPSDHNYIHGVNPVTSGHRYTLVTWMRVKGMPSVDQINQMAMDEYRRQLPKQIQQPPRIMKGGVKP